MRSKIIAAAVRFAEERHGGQLYGDEPYMVHLAQTVAWLYRLDPGATDSVVCAAWLHDVLEDTATSRDEIEARFGQEVAAIVDACTGNGANRTARMSRILRSIAALDPPELRTQAARVKLADRCANVEASGANDPGRLRMYSKELAAFQSVLREFCPDPAGWEFLQRALNP